MRGGTDLKSIQGKNAVISRGGKSLKAAITGYAYTKDGKVHIERNSMAIKGNVEASMGEIPFEENIFVTGSVLTGSEIKALGNIEIKGDIKSAKVISREGDVTIKGDVMNSVISADRRLTVRGRIIGGVAAGTWITTTNAGSRDHVVTRLMIASAEAYEILGELPELQEKIKMRSEVLDSISKELNTTKDKGTLREQTSNYFAVKKELDDLKARERELRETVIPKVRGWEIEVSGTLHPGVVISIDDMQRRISKKMVNVTFSEGPHGRIETFLG